MSATRNILRTYRAPGQVMRNHLTGPPREDRALVYLVVACGVIFVAQWPRLARQAALDDTIPFEGLLAGALFGWLFVVPILAYGLAALSHLIARALGGQGSHYGARLALFWALLASTPFFLLAGLASGFGVSEAALAATGIVVAAVFVTLWLLSLIAAERPETVASGPSAQ